MTSNVTLPGQRVIDVIPPGELAEIGILQAVPVLEVKWADERQFCPLVHDYLEGEIEGHLDEFSACEYYRARACRYQGGGALCLFHEPASETWQRARSWERAIEPDGTRAFHRRQ